MKRTGAIQATALPERTQAVRLGPSGFLAGDEVFRFGDVNAGLLDQQFALK